MWTGVDCDGGQSAVSVEDLLLFWVPSTELVEDTDMGSCRAVGAGEPKVVAYLSSRGCQTLAPSLEIDLKSSSVSFPPCLVCAWMMACARNLPICGRVLSCFICPVNVNRFWAREAIVD